jgi:hypothetical protein
MRHVMLPIGLALGLMLPVWRATASAATAVVLVDDTTPGYYNAALGTSLDGTQPQFPPADVSGGDPTMVPAPEPDLAAVATIVGDWLSPDPLPLNPYWSGLQLIPSTWAVNTETAIVYPIDAGPGGMVNLRGNFGIDNGIFVWVNGVFQFGAVAPGKAPAFEYAEVDLGSLPPGMNFIQIVREDHGLETGYTVRITGERLEAGVEFAINLTTFVPANFVQGPPQDRCLKGGVPPTFEQIYFAGDDRTFTPAAPAFRTRQMVTVIPAQAFDPDGLQEGSERHLVGETKAYAEDALEDGRLDAADDDAVLQDCHLLHERETAAPENMHITVSRIDAQTVSVRMVGGPGIPLVFGGSHAGIDWDVTIAINTAGPKPVWGLVGGHDGFPAYELYVNGHAIYHYDPGPPPYGVDELARLLLPLEVFVVRAGELP